MPPDRERLSDAGAIIPAALFCAKSVCRICCFRRDKWFITMFRCLRLYPGLPPIAASSPTLTGRPED